MRQGSRVVSRTGGGPGVPATASGGGGRGREKTLEDQLFLTRLRRHMKWVFLLLALSFGIGYVVFGVGSGSSGSSLGDVLQDINGNDAAKAKSIADAQKAVADNPSDPEALLDLARAYQQGNQPGAQAAALEKYLELKPNDGVAISSLGRAYIAKANNLNQDANNLSATGPKDLTSQTCTFPGTTGFLGAVCEDPIGQAIVAAAGQRVADLFVQSNASYQKAVDAFERLTKVTPNDPNAWVFLAAAARDAGQADKQKAAYEEFLKRFPDDPNAADVKRILEQLQGPSNDTLVG